MHRDIKPANIMLEKGVTVKVADFGVAKIASAQRYTKTGATMGTPSYMSPEQVDGKPLDGRSDQFSLAVVAYELLAGSQPFEADSFTALAHAIACGPRPSARAANPELPSILDQVFYRGLGKLPEERYASCREFVAAIEQALAAQVFDSEVAPPVTVPRLHATPAVRAPGANPFRYVLGSAIVAILLAGAWWGHKPPATARTAPPGVPVILRFSAGPQSVEAGDLATLNWEVHGVNEVTITPDVGAVPATGRERVEPTAPTYYRLTAANPAGKVYLDAYVNVIGSPLSLCLAGESKLRNGQSAQGLVLLRRSAGMGEIRAMLDLGDFYSWNGKDYKRDNAEAAYWLDQAASAGSTEGMLDLGMRYYMGIGVPVNEQLAALWFGKAAGKGSSDAILNLGDMYERGNGFPKDLQKARELYRRASKMGNEEAQKCLVKIVGR